MAVAKAISSTPLFSSLRPVVALSVVRCDVCFLLCLYVVVLVVDCGFCVLFVVCVGSFQSVSWKFDF